MPETDCMRPRVVWRVVAPGSVTSLVSRVPMLKDVFVSIFTVVFALCGRYDTDNGRARNPTRWVRNAIGAI